MIDGSGLTVVSFRWIDPTCKIAAVFFTQVLPPGDPVAIELFDELERAVYKELSA